MDKSALHRFFLNDCSPAERKEVIAWLFNPQNDLLIKIWMKENWDLIPLTDTENKTSDPDVQQIWNDLSEKLFDRDASRDATVNNLVKRSNANFHYAEIPYQAPDIDITATPVKNFQARAVKTWWIAAASVIIALGFFAYGYRESILYIQYQTDFGEVAEFSLADGSHVVLNANSSLLVPRWGFNSGDRKVALQGEAAFNVTHTINDQKFLVTTNSQLNVEVLGTEFLLYSRNQTNRVILKKGSVKVRFNDEKRQPVLMKPGDVVTADKAGSLSVKHQQPISNSIPWKEHRFVFESTGLNEVVTHISEFFGDKIVIDNETIANKTITGSFSATSARELLAIISEIYNLEMEQTKGKIILREKGSVLIEQ
jgi:ferric-dicitrate binding protein FerR (iron transport regulator)